MLNATSQPNALVSSGMGDLVLMPKGVILDRDKTPIGMAVAIPVGLPTGNGGSFLGEDGVSLTPSSRSSSLTVRFGTGSMPSGARSIPGTTFVPAHRFVTSRSATRLSTVSPWACTPR